LKTNVLEIIAFVSLALQMNQKFRLQRQGRESLEENEVKFTSLSPQRAVATFNPAPAGFLFAQRPSTLCCVGVI
jgi:hypothetical protein